MSDRTLYVLYGSQTGTAENYARMLGLMATCHGYVPTVKTLDDGVEALKTGRPDALVIVCSTYGTGEFPTNARKMWAALENKQIDVKGVAYSMLGLGNSRFDNFCAAPKKLDAKLKELGAESAVEIHTSCEGASGGHEPMFRDWKKKVWAYFGSGEDAKLGVSYEVTEPKKTAVDVLLRSQDYVMTSVERNEPLTAAGYEPPAFELAVRAPLDVQEKMLGRRHAYNDHVEIMVSNSNDTLQRVFHALKISGDTIVHAEPKSSATPSIVDGKTFTLTTLFRDVLDVHGLPSRSLLEALSLAAKDPSERAALEDLANDLSENSQYAKLTRGVWSVLDCLEMFPSIQMTPAEILTHFPRIQPRTYSICADPEYTGAADLIHVCFSVAMKSTTTGKKFEGLCSGHMKHFQHAAPVNIKLVASGISTPPATAPVVAVALGTGIGSVRSIAQHRALVKRTTGATPPPMKVYYGFRHAGKDELYRKEFDALASEGIVELITAASHDQKEFVTPMDKVDASLPAFLGDAGHVVYCGLGGGIPMIIEAGLNKVGIPVAALRASGRYHEEYFTPDQDMENLLVAHSGANANATTLAGKIGQCDMFCFQCEQTFKNVGCTKVGVCGKTPRVARLQDLTCHAAKIVGFYCHELRQLGAPENDAANHLTLSSLFMTLTNVNFDEERFVEVLKTLNSTIMKLRAQYNSLCKKNNQEPKKMTGIALPDELPDIEGMIEQAKNVGVLTRFTIEGEQNGAGVSEMLIYGLKGLAAYTDHSLMNKKEDATIYKFMHEALAFLIGPEHNDLGKALGLLLECGNINVTAMSLLNKSNTTLGIPVPTAVNVRPVPGKCILVSGHDLIMLKGLLKLTEPLGINVYTHGEMLPAHGYPQLHEHKNLAGHFGGAWMRQAVEFPHFPGAIVMTTNCLTEPQEDYKATIFTAGAVGWSKIPHLGDDMDSINWTPAIEAAQKMPGFTEKDKAFTYADPIGLPRPEKYTVGFGHETILSVAPTIVEQINKGNITRFFVVGGCDGFEGPRSYYTELVKRMPNTAVVLTMGCGKFRFNHLELGTIGDSGIPRILDMGQCNDSFGAVQVALALAGVLKCEVSDLPLSIVLSWFEQKAIAVLLSCLKLGLKPIHVGPSLPAFITKDVLNVLVNDFGLRVCGDPEEDLKVMLAAKGMA